MDDCDATTATTPHTAFASKTGRNAAAIKELEEMSHIKNLGLRGRNCAFGGGGLLYIPETEESSQCKF